MPRTPYELCAARVREEFFIGVGFYAACAAAVEEEGEGDEVGGVEAGDGEREDVVEGDGGAEFDEGEETGADGGCGDAVDREGGAWVQLIYWI